MELEKGQRMRTGIVLMNKTDQETLHQKSFADKSILDHAGRAAAEYLEGGRGGECGGLGSGQGGDCGVSNLADEWLSSSKWEMKYYLECFERWAHVCVNDMFPKRVSRY